MFEKKLTIFLCALDYLSNNDNKLFSPGAGRVPAFAPVVVIVFVALEVVWVSLEVVLALDGRARARPLLLPPRIARVVRARTMSIATVTTSTRHSTIITAH